MAMGVNHLYGLTKNMIKSCPSIQDGRKLTNHSARRHLVQKLQDRGVQNTQIMQVSGHKNVQSVNTYSRLNQNQQKSISKVLSETEVKVVFDKGKSSENTNSNNSVRYIASCEMNPNLSQLSSTTSTSSITSALKCHLFFMGTLTFTEELLILTIPSLVRKDKVMIPDYK
jgi:ribonuclease HII